MDIDVHSADDTHQKGFGFGLVVALPTPETEPDVKRSTSLTLSSGEDAISPLPVQSVSASETKPKRKLSQKLRNLFKRKKSSVSGNSESTPAGGVLKQVKMPGGGGFPLQTSPWSSPLPAVYNESTAQGLASEPSPVMQRSLDLDDIPLYIMRAMNEQGSPEESKDKDRVKLKLLTEGGASTKKVTITRKQKFGIHFSTSLPPTVVTFVEPGSQCALAGVEVGDQVVAVNGKECTSSSSAEVRDLIYLGRVIKRASLHGQYSEPLHETSPQKGQAHEVIDEETWVKVKQTEETIEAYGSSSSSGKRFTVATDSKDGTPLWVNQTFTEITQPLRAKSMYVTSPAGLEQAATEFSKTSLDARSPLKHSTPNYAMTSSDSNAPDGLPRARVAATVDLGRRSVDLTDVLLGGRVAGSDEATGNTMQYSGRGRASMPSFPQASLSQPTPEPVTYTSPNSMQSFQREVSFGNSLSGIEENTESKMRSTSGSFDRSRDVEKYSSPEILPHASISMDTEAISEAPSDQSAELAHQASGLSLSDMTQPRKDQESLSHKKKSPLSTPALPVGEAEETEDIVRSFEEAIAASPTFSATRLMVTDSAISDPDTDASTLLTPQWIRDAAARRKTRITDEQSLTYQLQEKSKALQDTGGARKQLQFGHLGLDTAHDDGPHTEAHFLYGSGEFLASDSGSSQQHLVRTDWQRSKSMEWGRAGPEGTSPTRSKPTQGQPVQIDSNVRLRKKSGVMVGKHTAQTSRPTILDFGQSSENVNYPVVTGGPTAQTDSAPYTRPLAHSQSLLENITPSRITFEGTEQCKLLNVAAGRSKVHVTRHRSTKKRGASKKESLFLHTGDAERFGDRKVDPTNPMMVDRRQVVPAGRTDAGKKGASTSRLRVPQKDTSRDALNGGAIQQKPHSSSELKGRNMVIEASWKPTQEGGIARRATVSTKALSSAGLVSRASQKKRVSGGDTGVSLMEIEQQVLGGLHRNKQYSKSVVVKSKWEEVQEADSTAPPPKMRVPTEVQSRVAEKEEDAEVADSKASGIQVSGGSQTFQVPLRSVPSNQAKIDNIAETAEPSWVAIARGKSRRLSSKPASASPPPLDSPPTDGTGRTIVSEQTPLPDPIPQAGHVKERLKMFSQLK